MLNVKKYRAIFGLTQEELAQKIGCSRTNVVYMESDECNSLSKAIEEKLCALFNINLVQLYGEDNFKHYPNTDEEKANVIMLLFRQIESDEQKKEVINILRGYQ